VIEYVDFGLKPEGLGRLGVPETLRSSPWNHGTSAHEELRNYGDQAAN
jgi:hypothetical protein